MLPLQMALDSSAAVSALQAPTALNSMFSRMPEVFSQFVT
jgi:hypothetical protein